MIVKEGIIKILDTVALPELEKQRLTDALHVYLKIQLSSFLDGLSYNDIDTKSTEEMVDEFLNQ